MSTNTETSSKPIAYRVSDFCAAMGISRSTFYKLAKDDRIRTVQIGGRRLIPAVEAQRLAAEGAR